MEPRVSICIPTRNAESYLPALLPALRGQRVEGGVELVVLDSDSGDCTRQLLRRAGARVGCIPQASFRHGPTRNDLAAMARGEILVFLSQDALPRGSDFIERLIAPLAEEDVAGSTARVLPHPGEDPLTARTVLAAPEAGEDAVDIQREGGGPRFNNVASAIRAEILTRIPFPDLPFGEDLAWARQVIDAGWRLRFQPSAVVFHAHTYTPSAAFERYRVDAAFHRRTGGERIRPSLWSVLRGIAYELRQDWRFVARHGGRLHLLRAPGLRGAQVLGQWFGSHGLSGRRGTEATRRYR